MEDTPGKKMRLTPREYWVVYVTLSYKELRRFNRTWLQSFVPSVLTVLLYFLVFGHIIGSRIGLIDGFPYMKFITPGLLVMLLVNNAYNQSLYGFFFDRFQHSIQEIFVAPVPHTLVLASYLSISLLRSLLASGIVVVISFMLGSFSLMHPALFLVSCLLCATLASLGGALNALFASTIVNLPVVANFVLSPLFYLGGVFYSTHSFSPLWKELMHFNPIFYLVSLFRYTTLGQADVSPAVSLMTIIALCFFLYALLLYLLHKGIRLKP